MALARLGDRRVQQEHAVRSVHDRAARRRPAARIRRSIRRSPPASIAITATNAEGGIIPEEYAAEYVVDRVATTSTVFLGLTMGCARCHDHKYDPFTQKEFYQLFAYFNNVPEHGRGRTGQLASRTSRRRRRNSRSRTEEARRARRVGDERASPGFEPKLAAAAEAWLKSLADRAAVQWAPTRGLQSRITHWTATLQGDGEPSAKSASRRRWTRQRRICRRDRRRRGKFDGKSFIDAGDVGEFRRRSTSSRWAPGSIRRPDGRHRHPHASSRPRTDGGEGIQRCISRTARCRWTSPWRWLDSTPYASRPRSRSS